MKKISVVGIGYIGLPTAAIIASNGYCVNGVDVDSKITDTINNGNIHNKSNCARNRNCKCNCARNSN